MKRKLYFTRLCSREQTVERKRSRHGFSLMEILIVLGIIALLAGVVVTNFTGIFGGAQDQTAKSFVEAALEASLLKFKIDTGNFPSTAEGIGALLTAPPGKAAKWKGPYIEKMPIDPWGNPYQYRFPGPKNPIKYDLFSFAADGVQSADDIGNWD